MKSRLSEDSNFKAFCESWKKSSTYKELAEQIDKKKVRIPQPNPSPSSLPWSRRAPKQQDLFNYNSHPKLKVCHNCQEEIDREEENFYTIEKFCSGERKGERSIFHKECFKAVAGDEFL